MPPQKQGPLSVAGPVKCPMHAMAPREK